MPYYETDMPVVTNGNCKDNGAFGGDWWGGIIGLIAVAAIFGGGFGNGGLFGGGNRGTDAAVQRGFDTSAVLSKLDGINSGLCDGFYAMNTGMITGFSNVQQSLCNGFNGVQTSIADLGYKLQDCCCQTQRAIDGVNYNLATQACDIKQSIGAQTQAILGWLTQEKISSLQAENQSLKFAASQSAQNAFITANQEAQTAELIRRLGRDVPSPAYLVPNPNCCYNYSYNPCGCNTGCGCGASVQ